MSNSAVYRLQQVLLEKNCSVNRLSSIAGISQSTLNKQMRGDASVSLKTIESVLDIWPDVSAEWLLRGDGDMFKSDRTTNTQVNYGNNSVQAIGGNVGSYVPYEDVSSSPLYDAGPTSFDKEANALVKKSNVLRVMRPEIPDQLTGQPEINVLDYLIENKDNLNYEPFVPQFCEYTATKRVTTDAMSPEVRRGDKIAVKVMPTKNIIDGEMYLIDTKSRGLVLRVLHDEGDSFLCTSLNIDRYKDMRIDKDDVIRVWSVVGALKIYL